MAATLALEPQPILGPLDEALACLQSALEDPMWRLADGEVGQAVEKMDGLRRQCERALLQLVGEADSRGFPVTVPAVIATPAPAEDVPAAAQRRQIRPASLVDWLLLHCPSLSATEASQLVKVARSCAQPGHAPLTEAVTSGSVPVRKAARLVDALAQLRPFVPAEELEVSQQTLLPLAACGSDRDWRAAVDHLVACAAPAQDVERLARARCESRNLSVRTAAAGMVEYVWRLDPEGAAVVASVTQSLLAKPTPDESGPDPRSPGQRRSDALLAVVKRGLAAPDEVHTNGAVTLLVTVDHATLTGAADRAGVAADGQLLTAGQLRRLACEADLVPAVLAGPSAPLDLGRTRRLATRAQHLALNVRDGGCTIPGCTVPAAWCIAHHLIWWSRGGLTDLGNLALLCGRHHALVHERDMRGVVTLDGVSWDP